MAANSVDDVTLDQSIFENNRLLRRASRKGTLLNSIGMHLVDGLGIDFVLVYRGMECNFDAPSENKNKQQCIREYYLAQLERRGLILTYREVAEDPFNSIQLDIDDEMLDKKVDEIKNKFLNLIHKKSIDSATNVQVNSTSSNNKTKVYFVLVHAPWKVLVKNAENVHLYMPFEDKFANKKKDKQSFFDKIKVSKFFGIFKPKVPEHLECPDMPSQSFVYSKRHQFYGIENEETYFSSSQRSLIVKYLLDTTPYDEDLQLNGFNSLIHKNIFDTCYPLHEGSLIKSKINVDRLTERQFLYKNWASSNSIFKFQPLDQIRHYFGEKIAIYFAWLGFYTQWLHYASVVGCLVFLVSIYTIFFNSLSTNVCNSTNWNSLKLFYMCPACNNRCDFTRLYDSCFSFKFSHMFDYFGTVLYAVFMSLWAVFFLEFWKRYQFTLQYEWDTLDFEEITKSPRPQFEAAMKRRYHKASDQEKNKIYRNNPVTQQFEYYQSEKIVKSKILVTLSTLLTIVLVLLGILVGIVFYRALISPLLAMAITRLSSYDPLSANILTLTGSLIITTSAAFIQLLFIMVMNKFYEVFASKLTNWELHKTQSDHEDSFIVKMFIFQFVNFYSSLFYIAFLKGKIITHYPGDVYLSWFYGLETCNSYGCLLELTLQLIIIFILKQTLNNIVELGKPLIIILHKHLITKIRSLKGKSYPIPEKVQLISPWERDYKLANEQNYGLFFEYLELVIQYGFVTIFAAAFPLAPLFALFNNYLEIRIDAFKYLVLTRRVLSSRVPDIGSWYALLDLLSKIAVVTNAFLIPFTGTFIDRILYQIDTDMISENGFLNFSLETVHIHHFMYTADFPDHDIRILSDIIGQTKPKYMPYFIPETLYCYLKSYTCNVNNTVLVNNTITNVSNCCNYLKSQGNYSNGISIGINGSACLFNNSKVKCCRNVAAIREITFFAVNDSLMNISTSCCDSVDRMLDYKLRPMSSGIYYKQFNVIYADQASPINGVTGIPLVNGYNNATFNDGCFVNRINFSATCRYPSSFVINKNADANDKLKYYQLMLGRFLFVIVFEHAIFVILSFVAFLIPDLPQNIKNELFREKFLLKYGQLAAELHRDEEDTPEINVTTEELDKFCTSMQSINSSINPNYTTSFIQSQANNENQDFYTETTYTTKL